MMYKSHLLVDIQSSYQLIIFFPPRLRRRRQDEAWMLRPVLPSLHEMREKIEEKKKNGHWVKFTSI